MKTLLLVLMVALLAWAVPSSNAQFSYSQNFDTMGPAGTTLPPGWIAGYLGAESSVNRATMVPYAGNGLSITPMPVVVSDGSALPAVNVGTVLNLGTTGSSDRALGNYPRTTPSGDQIMQVALQNNTGGPLAAVQLSYWGEQWRQSQGTSSSGPEILRVLASTTDSLSGFTYFSGLDFLAPKQTTADAPVGGLDGNLAANRVFITGIITFQSAVPNGGMFYIRWHDWNDNGTTDHFLGIDDVHISVVPTYTLTITTNGIGSISPGSGTYPSGSNVVLTATPNSGYAFSGWAGAVTGTNNPTSVAMTSNKAITGSFVFVTNSVLVYIGPVGPAAQIAWFAASNFHYQVQAVNVLNSNVWFDLGGQIPGNNATNYYYDPFGTNQSRFYRVMTRP